MLSKITEKISAETGEICKVYAGKSIFITGASGFLGSVILEKLLSCCPGIEKIYILLRSKSGMAPEDRKEQIFKKEIFKKLKEDNPDALEKVTVIAGDISEENLGMSEIDLQRMTNKVSIVFHIAANISFFKPLSFMVKHNVIGLDNIIDFCRKLDKLETLVYSSTIYANSNQQKITEIDEKIYELPFKVEDAVMLARNGDTEGLNHLFSSIDPPFYNFYTFSKCLAENLLAEKASDLPVSIVRPSIIVCCMKGSMPGYIEEGSFIVNLSLGVGKGFIRVAPLYNDEMKIELVTADVAANTHIVAAYLQATESLPSPIVYNCTLTSPISWDVWFSSLMNMVKNHPLPNSYLIPNVVLCKSPNTYKLYSLIYHYLPGFTIDIFLQMLGSKFRMVKTYQFYDKSLEKLEPFIKAKWSFKCENFNSMSEKLNSADAEIFCVDMKDFCIEKLIECLRSGCPFYRVGDKPYEEKFRNTLIRYFVTYLLKFAVPGGITLLLLGLSKY